MALVVEENVRVLRKRKITLELTSIKSNSNSYDVLKEHNYFNDIKKKRCRWSQKNYSSEDSSIDSNEKKSINNCDDNDEYHSDNEMHSLLKKEFTLSSNESSCDEVVDYKEKSLAQLLQMEYIKDLEKEDQNSRYSKYFLLLNKNELCPVSIESVNDHEMSSGLIKLKPKLINHRYTLNVSKDSKYTSNIEKPIKLNATKVKDTKFENQNIINDVEKVKPLKVFQKRSKIFRSYMNLSQFKSKAVKNISKFELFLNNPLIKKSRKDSCKNELQNNSFKSSTDSTNILVNKNSSLKKKICCISGVDSFDQDLFDNNVPEPPKNVCPPLDWILLIYLTIKNSSGEYVTCYDVQIFSRHWFNYYCDKPCINDIRSALSRYSEEYFHSFSITVDSGNMWTVKNESVITLETILKTVTYKYKDEIKSSMKNPDHLHILLNGYGVFNLGYQHEERIKRKY